MNLFAPIGVAFDKNNIEINKSVVSAAAYNVKLQVEVLTNSSYLEVKAKVLDSSSLLSFTPETGSLSTFFVEAILTNSDGTSNNDAKKGLMSQDKNGIVSFNFEGLKPDTSYNVLVNLIESINGSNGSTFGSVSSSTDNIIKFEEVKGVKTLVKEQISSVSQSVISLDAEKKQPVSSKKLPACSMNPLSLSEGTFVGCISQAFYYVLFVPTSYLFALAGTFFDYTFAYSVQDSSYRSAFVVQGWGLVRDFCNIFFIFVMLYIAIGTILSLHNFKTKETIINVVIIGLFINFSLFATQVIIDASNITARVFYNSDSIKITEKGANGVTEATTKVGDGGIIPLSAALVNKVNPQNLITRSGEINNIPDKGGVTSGSTGEDNANMDAGTFILIIVMASAINIIGLSVFMTVGLLFVARVIGLWLAMIMAPLAFFTYILPQLEGIKMIGWKNWWPDTLKLAFLAPVFIFFMYLILKFLQMDLISDPMNKTIAADGLGFFVATIIPFAFIMILMMKAKKIAADMAGEMGTAVTKIGAIAGGLALGAASGGAAVVMRGTVGRLGSSIANSERLKSAESKGVFGAKLLRNFGKTAGSGSMDIRGVKIAGKGLADTGLKNLGKAKEGGFTKLRADKTAERQKRAKELELGEDSKLSLDLKAKETQLKDLQNDNAHDLERIEATITTKRQASEDANRLLLTDPKNNVLIESAKRAAKELEDIKQEKTAIRTGGPKKDHHGNIIKNPDGSVVYNTTNGKISMTEVTGSQKASTEAQKMLSEQQKKVNDVKTSAASNPDVVSATNKKAKADSDLINANNALLTAKSKPGFIIGSDAALVSAVNDAKAAAAEAEKELIKSTDEVKNQIIAAEAELKTIEKIATDASVKAAADIAASANGTGKSMNELQFNEIPDAHNEVAHENNARKRNYATYLSSNSNKVINFIQSGGQHSSLGADEAAYRIRMNAKIESSGGGHAAPAAAAHAAPKPAPAAAHAAPAAAAGGGGHH